MGRQGFPGILGTEGVKVKKTHFYLCFFFIAFLAKYIEEH